MKCPNCNEKIVKYSLKDKDGKFIFKNLFKMDLMSLIFFIVVIGLFLMVKTDLYNYKEIVSNPVKFCNETKTYERMEEQAIESIGELEVDEELLIILNRS